MKILFYPHDMAMGGSQLNAIELAAGVRDLGHEVIVYGKVGPLVEKVESHGLEFVESPRPRIRPTPSIVSDLRRIADEREIDVLHGFEWPPALECRLAAVGSTRTTAVATVMSMSVADFIPKDMPLTVGTEQIAAEQAKHGWRSVQLLEPPVDTAANAPDEDLGKKFREEHSIPQDSVVIVVVSRLAHELKLEGILASIECVAALDPSFLTRLVIVGDGPAMQQVQDAAFRANARRPESVVLTGGLIDPRPAYAAADIALGMGGSALRAMAFGKPLVVQGESGYWETLTHSTLAKFQWQGWYGVSDNAQASATRLRVMLEPLLRDRAARESLGQFGREAVVSGFSLDSGARILEAFYEKSLRTPEKRAARITAGAMASLRFGEYLASRAVQKVRRTAATDDFNRLPVVAARPETGAATKRRTVVHVAGTFWDDVQGTDHRMAQSISKAHKVIWVDPPKTLVSSLRNRRLSLPVSWVVDEVAPGVTRIRTCVPGGVSLPLLRDIYSDFSAFIVRRQLRKEPPSSMVLHTSASARFPRGVHGKKCYFVTDDWISGAQLMGLPVDSVEDRMRANLGEADLVAAVSPVLVRVVNKMGGNSTTRFLPNGCVIHEPVKTNRQPTVALLGQLNERLDMSLLETIQASGLLLDIAGPLRGTELEWCRRMEKLLVLPGVTWRGEIPAEEVPIFLSGTSVGVTPYALSDFNSSSFPLKTLDYLAAGLPAVSTNLPSSRWLSSEFVSIGDSDDEIVRLLKNELSQPFSEKAAVLRRVEAARHSWDQRASQLLAWIDDSSTGVSGGQPDLSNSMNC